MKRITGSYQRIFFTMLVLSTSALVRCQFLPNPSFEGPGGENQPPAPWIVCDNNINHPDGGDHSVIAIDLPASHGESYLSMRVRGSVPEGISDDYVDTREFCSTRMNRYMEKGVCYIMSVDLAYDDSVIYFQEYIKVYPTIFRVWGTYDGCSGVELLAESELIDNKTWERFQFSITPLYNNYDSLYIEPYYSEEVLEMLGTSDTTYNGMLLVDNIEISEEGIAGSAVLLDTVVWEGDPLSLIAGEGSNYVWDNAPELVCTDCRSQEITVVSPANFRVVYEDARGCSIQEVFTISVLNCETAYPDSSILRLDTVITETAELSLLAIEGESYSWSPANILTCPECRETQATIAYSTIIESMVTDDRGCEVQNIFRVKFEISYPNVITPNGDGNNETFEVRGLPPNSTFKVFTRSGVLVAKTMSYENNWAGRNRSGEPLPEDTYWFTLTNEAYQLNESGYIFIKR